MTSRSPGPRARSVLGAVGAALAVALTTLVLGRVATAFLRDPRMHNAAIWLAAAAARRRAVRAGPLAARPAAHGGKLARGARPASTEPAVGARADRCRRLDLDRLLQRSGRRLRRVHDPAAAGRGRPADAGASAV